MKPDQTPVSNQSKFDDPLELVPDEDEDELRDATVYRPRQKPRADEAGKPPPSPPKEDRSVVAADAARIQSPWTAEALQWALDSIHQPAIAAADWLARDIDPDFASAAALLSSPTITMTQVRQAKSAFKTMRIVGEKAADRRVGARMYAAAIAAGIVRFGKRVSSQSSEALSRGFQGLLDDKRMPRELRDLAGQALCALREMNDGSPRRNNSE